MIRVRISAADLHTALDDPPDTEIRYADGTFSIALRGLPLVNIYLKAHLDLRDGRVRACVPFRELTTERTGRLLGAVTGGFWPKMIEPRLEKLIADKLDAFGLPWDTVWVDTVEHPEHGRMGTVNLSPRIFNEWLRQRPCAGDLAPRMVSLDAEPAAVVFGFQLVARHEAAPVWSGGGDG